MRTVKLRKDDHMSQSLDNGRDDSQTYTCATPSHAILIKLHSLNNVISVAYQYNWLLCLYM